MALETPSTALELVARLHEFRHPERGERTEEWIARLKRDYSYMLTPVEWTLVETAIARS